MSATIIDGQAVAAQCARRWRATSRRSRASTAARPGLATILVGDDPASAVYVGGKQKATREVGIRGFDHRSPADAPQDEVVALIEELNADPRVSGHPLQLPTPEHSTGRADRR